MKLIFADQTEVNFTYDEIGRVRTATDERGKTYTYEYDPACGCADRLTKITDPTGKSYPYAYDDTGRRISFTDADNRETRYKYDVRDQPDEGHALRRLVRRQHAYDGAGRPSPPSPTRRAR